MGMFLIDLLFEFEKIDTIFNLVTRVFMRYFEFENYNGSFFR